MFSVGAGKRGRERDANLLHLRGSFAWTLRERLHKSENIAVLEEDLAAIVTSVDHVTTNAEPTEAGAVWGMQAD